MRTTARIAAALAVVAAGGCGNDAPPRDTTPIVRFTFTSSGTLVPAVARADGPRVRVVAVSADGRPHGVTIAAPGRRVRLLVEAGRQAQVTLTGLRSGTRVGVVPDGATEPVTLQVR